MLRQHVAAAEAAAVEKERREAERRRSVLADMVAANNQQLRLKAQKTSQVCSTDLEYCLDLCECT